MSIIRIFANSIELDVVKETLTIKKENNSFSTDFRVSHSSFPFLVIENENTNRALGTRDMTSIVKRKVVPVLVIEMGERYEGELQIVSYTSGFRKCNIRYGVAPIAIMDKKLADFLPVVSIIPGETSPVPFTEENISLVSGYLNWETYPLQFAGKIYPEVKFQFPQMSWANKFFEERPEEGEEWYYYGGFYNKFRLDPEEFIENYYTLVGETEQLIKVININVPSPQLFMLAILEFAFSSIGWKIGGDFVNSEFMRRVLLLSTKHNLCKVTLSPEEQLFEWDDLTDIGQVFYHHYKYDIVIETAGTYTFVYNVDEPLRPGGITNGHYSSKLFWQLNPGTILKNQNLAYGNVNDPGKLKFIGSFEVEIADEDIGSTIRIVWGRYFEADPNPINFSVRWANESKPFQMMHPTIQLGRYAPDWSLSTFINELKNKFCLDVGFDNTRKIASFNWAPEQITNTTPFILKNSLAIGEYAPPQYNAFILKNSNDQDTWLYVDQSGITPNKVSESDQTNTIESQFKLVPYNGYTADLSQMEEKDGVGLMLFNPPDSEDFELPLIVSDYNGQTLAWEGALGIYNLYHKNFIKFRLNASSIELSGPFTGQELSVIDSVKKIHTGHQAYMVISMEFSETLQDNFNVKLQLESINY